MTGDDDPDDRRTYPWADLGGTPDTALLAHYTALAALRRDVAGADRRRLPRPARRRRRRDGRATAGKTGARPRSSSLNRSGVAQTLDDPGRRLPARRHRSLDATASAARHGAVGRRRRGRGHAAGRVAARVLADRHGRPRRRRRPRPASHVDRRGRRRRSSLAWNAVAGAAGYDVYRSPVIGRRLRQGERRARSAARRSPITGPRRTRRTVLLRRPRARRRRQRERRLERGRRRCRTSTIGWANLQWPPTMTHTISAVNRTDNVYGQVWIDGATSQPGPTPRPARPARLRAGRLEPGRQRRVDVGRRGVQHATPATTTSSSPSLLPEAVGHLRLRLPLLDDRRPRLGLRRPRRARSTATARPTRAR